MTCIEENFSLSRPCTLDSLFVVLFLLSILLSLSSLLIYRVTLRSLTNLDLVFFVEDR